MNRHTGAARLHATDADLEAIEAQITELAAHIAAARCRLVELLARYDEMGGWQRGGHASLAHWLNWRLGMGMGAARETVRVARALPELPTITAAFRVGALSYSKVRALTRVATPNNEAVLLKLAREGTASQLERILSGYRKAQSLKDANAAHARRGLECWYSEDGELVVRGRLPAEAGAALMAALDAAREVPDPDADSDEPPSAAATRADALARIAESYLQRGDAPGKGGDRHLVNVVVNPDALRCDADRAAEPRAGLAEGHACLSTATAQRIACDASLMAIYENNRGEPLSVGRRTRIIPPAIERALRRRDRGCRFPGCSHTKYVDAHHVVHWAHGGETSLDNLVLLCRRHHRLVHEGGFRVAREAGGIVFRSPAGAVITPNGDEAAAERSRGNVLRLYHDNASAGVDPPPESLRAGWSGERFERDYIVSLVPEP